MALAGVGETSLNKLLRSTFAQVSPQPGPRDFSWRNQDFDQRSACPFVLHAKLASAEKEWNWGTLAMCCSAAAAGKAHRPHVAIFDLASFGDASVQGEGAGRAHP